MTDDRPYIELKFTGTTLTQSSNASNPLGGTNIVIDYGDGNIEQYNGDFSHTYDTNGVYTIQIYGVTTIKNYCFYQCSGLTSVSIPNSVTSLGESCFSGCSDLTSVSIPYSITSLTYSCFYNCSNLNDIFIPDSVTYIGPNCFYKCSSLTSVSIPDSVTYIGNYCFMRCSDLINISIASSVTYIGGNVFQYCSNLTNIELNWTSLNDIITYEATWIRNTNNNLAFTVPQETNSLYIEKGYPSAQVKNKPSYILFTDVKKMLLNNNEVESIVVDEVDGRVLYQKPHTEIILSASNDTVSYGETVTLNGTVTGLNSGTVKLYQNNTLIDTLTIGSNGSFTKTISNLNVGRYTYKAVYDGDTTHNDGKSSEIIVKVNKVKPVLTISCDKNVIHPNEIITLTGTTTFDGTIILKYYEGYDVSKAYQLATIESSNGVFTYTFTNTFTNITNIKIYAMMDISANNSPSFSPNITLTNTKYSTNLTIEVPTLVYSDIFDVTGVLTDENNNPINNASVKLYRDGNILEATETTNSNGEVTFHRNAPTSITTYTFQLQYSGDTYYDSSNSSVATRTVTKETSILNITTPLTNSNYSNNELITVNGNLSDNDATPLTNKKIFISIGDIEEYFDISNGNITGHNLDENLTYVLTYDYSGNGDDEVFDYITETHGYQYDGNTYHIYSTESTQNDINNAIQSNDTLLLSKIEEYDGINFNYLGEIAQSNTNFVVGNLLDIMYTDSDGDFSGTLNTNLLSDGDNDLIFIFLEEEYYTGVTQTITINIGETIPVPSSLTLSASKPILSSADAFKNWTQPFNMGIDEENDLPYITATGSGVVLSNLALPNEFEINYKFKTTNNTASENALLFNIGTDVNNGILIGNEGSSRQMHIYTRVNNSNTGVAIQQNVYNYQEWTDVNIRYEDNIISLTMNGETISYTLTSPDLIQNYLAVYGTGVPNVRFTNFEIIDLSDNNIVYSSHENISTEITALVLDENDNPIENEIVTFNIGLHEIQRTTNSDGVAKIDYTSKQYGDITVTATLNNLSDSLIIEDCLYYNDGSSITNLRKQSNINLTTNGEWITISKSSSGEECVWLPAPLCCFTGSDNWEMSMKCNPSDYSNQALAIQMYGCNYGSYSGDSQYWGYTPNAFYGYLTGNYTLTSSDKVTYRRENGYWKVYVNDNTLITSKSYNWSNNRQVGLYSNSGRRQNVKEWKVKKNVQVNDLKLVSDKSRVNIDNDETVTLSATLTSLNMPVSNKIITFKEDGVVIGTATTDNNGVATYTYAPVDYGDYTVGAEYSTLSESVVINANDGSNILYYNSGADLSKVSDFDMANGWAAKNASNGTYTVSSDGEEWLTVTRSGGSNYGHIPISPLTGINVPFKLSVIVEMIAYGDPYNASYSGLYALNKSTNYSFLCQWGYPFRMVRSDKGSSDNWNVWNSGGNVSNGTYKYEVVFEASRVTHNLYDLNDTLLKTYNTTTSLNHTTATAEFGIHTDINRNLRIKEIIAERLD